MGSTTDPTGSAPGEVPWRLGLAVGLGLLVAATAVPAASTAIHRVLGVAVCAVAVASRRRGDLGAADRLHRLLVVVIVLATVGRLALGATPTASDGLAFAATAAAYVLGAVALVWLVRHRARPRDGSLRFALAALLPIVVMAVLLAVRDEVVLTYVGLNAVVVALSIVTVVQPRRTTTPLVLVLVAVGASSTWDLTTQVLGIMAPATGEPLAMVTLVMMAATAVHPRFSAVVDLGTPRPVRVALVRSMVLGISLAVLLVVGLLQAARSGTGSGLALGASGLVASLGVVVALVRAQRDLALEQAAERRRLRTDPVTGLLNLAGVVEEAASRPGRWAAVVVDLRGFRAVNEAFGFDVGDEVLRAAAEWLVGAARAGDARTLVARHAADTFVVLVDDADPALVEHLARRLLAVLHRGLTVGRGLRWVAADGRVGLSLPDDAAVGEDDAGELRERIRQAVTAVARAKRSGSGEIVTYTPRMAREASDQVALTLALEQALRAPPAGLRVVHQPLVELGSGRVVAAEVLARWRRDDGEEVQPERFVALAEATGLIGRLGETVLDLACRDLVRLRRMAPSLRMHVNVSPLEVGQPGFDDRVLRTLVEHGLPADALVVEVTEGVLVRDVARARATLAGLAGAGVHVALDDFGTGYASLAHLDLPGLAMVKVDRSFVARYGVDGGLLADTVRLLAKQVGCVVAEGVEDECQAVAVTTMGCHLGQGALFGLPVPVERFEERLRAVVATVG